MLHQWIPSFDPVFTAQRAQYMNEFDAAMIAAGLARTQDTGQFDGATLGTLGFALQFAKPMVYKWPGEDGYPDLFVIVTFGTVYGGAGYQTSSGNCVSVSVCGATNGASAVLGAGTPAQHSDNLNATSGTNAGLSLAPGVIYVSDDVLGVCVNPRNQASIASATAWGLPFFVVERQRNGDFHSSYFLSNASALAAQPPFTVQSVVNGVAKSLAHACPFIDGPITRAGKPTYQPFYRNDRDNDLAPFKPLIAVQNAVAYGMTVEDDEGNLYMGVGDKSGARVSSLVANLAWLPAMMIG